MATINGLYIFVTSEQLSHSSTFTEHTVESGVAISDHVKRNAMTLAISGEIVGENADVVHNKLRQMNQSGTLCKYVGRTTFSNCVITEFSITQSSEIWGGFEFSMTLKEIRTAGSSYNKPVAKVNKTNATKNAGTQQKTNKSKETNVYHTVKKGDTVWALVAASKAPYKNLKRPPINGKSYSACDWVMQKNQSAFSRKGDFGTLQIKAKLLVGVR